MRTHNSRMKAEDTRTSDEAMIAQCTVREYLVKIGSNLFPLYNMVVFI
jgi:hypothetical protein